MKQRDPRGPPRRVSECIVVTTMSRSRMAHKKRSLDYGEKRDHENNFDAHNNSDRLSKAEDLPTHSQLASAVDRSGVARITADDLTDRAH